MSLNKSLRVGYGFARVGFGIFASSRPTQMGRTWVGEDAESPGSEVILRALGFRDIALGVGVTEAALNGDPRSWLAVSMLSDLGDVTATLIGRKRIEQRGVAITTALAGAGALAAGILLVANDAE